MCPPLISLFLSTLTRLYMVAIFQLAAMIRPREHTAGRRSQEVNHLKSLRETEWLFACVTRSFLSVFRLQSVSEHLTYAHFYNPSGSRQ